MTLGTLKCLLIFVGVVGARVEATNPPQAVLFDDIAFQQVGQLHPHETNLLVRTDLSYATLEAVPQKTERIANILKELAENLTKVEETDEVPQPLVLSGKSSPYRG